jgi:small GTP-binding protein
MSQRESIGSLNSQGEKPLEIKLVILGRSLVGKSALTFRFINDQFPKDHDTTIEDQYKFNINIDGTNCLLEILDTAGQDDYQSMLETWINFGSGFLLVYSIDDHDSFEEVKKKYEKITQIKAKEIYSCILVGNKCDLGADVRQVPLKEGEEFANSKGIPFLETSALNKINVKESFIKVVHDLLGKMQEKNKAKLMGKMCGCNII